MCPLLATAAPFIPLSPVFLRVSLVFPPSWSVPAWSFRSQVLSTGQSLPVWHPYYTQGNYIPLFPQSVEDTTTLVPHLNGPFRPLAFSAPSVASPSTNVPSQQPRFWAPSELSDGRGTPICSFGSSSYLSSLFPFLSFCYFSPFDSDLASLPAESIATFLFVPFARPRSPLHLRPSFHSSLYYTFIVLSCLSFVFILGVHFTFSFFPTSFRGGAS